jgi:NAD(P)-dependent dehydrogenase (short-subunit alcohol dehydrogenase family)
MSISTWLITGASSGLGYALAEHVLKQGDQVVPAARTVASMEALAASYPNTALAVGLDVSDPQQRVADNRERHVLALELAVHRRPMGSARRPPFRLPLPSLANSRASRTASVTWSGRGQVNPPLRPSKPKGRTYGSQRRPRRPGDIIPVRQQIQSAGFK